MTDRLKIFKEMMPFEFVLFDFNPESIKVTRAVLDVSLGEAKRIVHESATWADARASFEELQDSVLSQARSVTS